MESLVAGCSTRWQRLVRPDDTARQLTGFKHRKDEPQSQDLSGLSSHPASRVRLTSGDYEGSMNSINFTAYT